MQMQIPQFPEYEITIKLFKNCEQTCLPAIDSEFGIIDASKIYSTNVLYSAIYKAIVESKYNRMRTKNLNSEVILSLYASTNIGEAFKQMGLNKKTTKHVITLSITQKNDQAQSIDQDLQNSQEIEFTDTNLSSIRDTNSIKAIYKLESNYSEDDLENTIINAIQLRGL